MFGLYRRVARLEEQETELKDGVTKHLENLLTMMRGLQAANEGLKWRIVALEEGPPQAGKTPKLVAHNAPKKSRTKKRKEGA